MLSSYTLFVAAFAGQALGGNILAPPSRDVSGPATAKACGTELATYLKKNPTAELYNISAATGPGYDADACRVDLCAGYQYADSPASHTVHISTSETLAITVNYTIPSKPLGSSDYYNLYGHTLSLINSTSQIAVLGTFGAGSSCGTDDVACATTPQTQVLTFSTIDFAADPSAGYPFPTGSCSQPGECYISWQLLDYFRDPNLVSARIIDAGCVDIAIDWSSSSRK